MKLVPEWKKAWRWFSMQAMVAAAAIQTVWINLPPDLRSAVPDYIVTYGTLAIIVFGVVGRLVSQS